MLPNLNKLFKELDQVRNVALPDGTAAFRLHFRYRNPHRGRGSVHGVRDDSVINAYEATLVAAYTALRDSPFGWPSLSGIPISVFVFDLSVYGKDVDGLAVPGNASRAPFLALSNENRDVLLGSANDRMRATAIHELTHLFQFEYHDLRTGTHWRWLDEATATASESVAFQTTDNFRFLADWFVKPETAIDSGLGYAAFPFITDLTRRISPTVIGQTYRIGMTRGASASATECLAQAIERLSGVPFSSATDLDVFGSGYCVDSYFLGHPLSGSYNLQLTERFGGRLITESFAGYPVSGAAGGDSIEHLGCRYYRFWPTGSASNLAVQLLPSTPSAADALKAEIVGVSKDMRPGRRVQLKRADGETTSFKGVLPSFGNATYDHAVLVVANCSWGKASVDDAQFTISAEEQLIT